MKEAKRGTNPPDGSCNDMGWAREDAENEVAKNLVIDDITEGFSCRDLKALLRNWKIISCLLTAPVLS